MVNNIGSDAELRLFAECLHTNMPASIHSLSNSSFAIIGSGLSFAVASFLSAFLDEKTISNRVYTPLEYCRSAPNAIPILITYRGKNHDIESVCDHMVRYGVTDCIILSGVMDYPIAEYLEKNDVKIHKIVLPEHAIEHRFVSFRATMSMIILSYAFSLFLTDTKQNIPDKKEVIQLSEKSVKKANVLANGILQLKDWRHKKWLVLGRGFLDPFAVLIQSVFAESGLASIQIADYKDYTHGKYLAAFQENCNLYLLLNYPQIGNIFNIMQTRFSPAFQTYDIPVSTHNLESYFEGAMTIFFLAAFMTQALNYNFQSPPKPAEMRNWSSWGKIK